MKKITLFIVLMLIGSMTFAFDFGLKAGYNGNKLSTNLDSISDQFKSGFHIGAWARIGKRFYVQPELYYSLQGAEYAFEDPLNADSWTQKLTLGTLDIPVLIGYKLLKSEKTNVRVMAGPMVSILVNSKITSVGSITDPIEKADLKTANWAIQLGAGADLWFLSLDIRYQLGLNEMIQEVEEWDFSSHNNVFVVSLGFKIF